MCHNCGAIGRKLKTQKLLDCAHKGKGMCDNYGAPGHMKTQKLLDCALIRVGVCAIITVL